LPGVAILTKPSAERQLATTGNCRPRCFRRRRWPASSTASYCHAPCGFPMKIWFGGL